MRTVAVVLAGGAGLRLGGTVPKQLQVLAGRTLLEHCVAAFEQADVIAGIVVVMPAEFVTQTARLLGSRYRKLSDVIAGGADRPGSTRRAIDLLSRAHPDEEHDVNVLFHDAARPLVDQRIIADCVAALGRHEAIGVVVPTTDTVVQMSGDRMVSIPPRESLGRCQTPQGFRLSVIRRAYQLAEADLASGAFVATDDCGLVLRYLPEVEIRVVAGSERNLKITYPGDLRLAEATLEAEATLAPESGNTTQKP